jgi:hypothetical protein
MAAMKTIGILPPQAGADEQDPQARRSRQGTHQRLFLDILPEPLEGGTWAFRPMPTSTALRPGLDLHRPEHGPAYQAVRVIKEEDHDTILKTGFEAVIRRREGVQMPYFEHFETDTVEKMLAFQFDDPWDDRRYFSGGTTR